MGSCNFESVREFTYLDVSIKDENKIEEEIQKIIVNGNSAYFSLLQLFRSNLLCKRTKVKLYKTLVRPVIAYGAETWTMRAVDELALRILERRIMRIYGPIFAQGSWQIGTNSEINELISRDNIIGFVKTLRLKWLGHVERMHSGRTPKMILKARMERGRKRRRPRKRWLDDDDDLQQLGVRNWRLKARDRVEWRTVMSEAKVQLGL
jgi:hypothetical protein